MTMDRRDFIVGGTALIAVEPAAALSLPPLRPPVPDLRAPVLMIHGWSNHSNAAVDREPIDVADQYWITINSSWRTAWR